MSAHYNAVHVAGHTVKHFWSEYRRSLRKLPRRLAGKNSERVVHKARVSARNLSTALDLAERVLPPGDALKSIEKTKKGIKRLFKSLGDLRDAQLQFLAIDRYYLHNPDLKAFRSHLLKRVKRTLPKAARVVNRERPDRIKASILSVIDSLENHQGELGYDPFGVALDSAYVAMKQCKGKINRKDPKTIHRFRLAFKQYSILAAALDKSILELTKAQAEGFKRARILLGEFNDLTKLITRLEKYTTKSKKRTTKLAALERELKANWAKLSAQIFIELKQNLQITLLPRENFRIIWGSPLEVREQA